MRAHNTNLFFMPLSFLTGSITERHFEISGHAPAISVSFPSLRSSLHSADRKIGNLPKIFHQNAVNLYGRKLTKAVLCDHFEKAREAAAILNPDIADDIRSMWFYDLRAKAADDTADKRGGQAASDLLGHENTRTTARHYLRQGKKVSPTK